MFTLEYRFGGVLNIVRGGRVCSVAKNAGETQKRGQFPPKQPPQPKEGAIFGEMPFWGLRDIFPNKGGEGAKSEMTDPIIGGDHF